MTYFYKTINSPVGKLKLIANKASLVAILWNTKDTVPKELSGCEKDPQNKILLQAEKELAEYFQNKRKKFNVPIEFVFGTAFQKNVWKNLLKIPYGKKISYLTLAEQLRNPKACRAVGAANGKNPLSIIVPCHRVIGKNGSLTGFAGGLNKKSFLLDHEANF